MFAIENDRVTPWSDTVTSTYWPGKYRSSVGSSRVSVTCRRSWVTASMAATSAVARCSGNPDLIMSSS